MFQIQFILEKLYINHYFLHIIKLFIFYFALIQLLEFKIERNRNP